MNEHLRRHPMGEMIARCGFKCHLCLAFQENNKDHADQIRVAKGWSKYFDLNVPAEKIRCNGCLPDDSGGLEFPDKNCPIRPCVIERGLENCAYCEDYPCEKLETRMSGVEEVAKRFYGTYRRRSTITSLHPMTHERHWMESGKKFGSARGRKCGEGFMPSLSISGSRSGRLATCGLGG